MASWRVKKTIKNIVIKEVLVQKNTVLVGYITLHKNVYYNNIL